MSSEMIEIPAEGLSFSALVTLAAPASSGPRRFSGVAYGGGVITDHPYWDAVAFDLAGLKASAPMPLLLQHDQDQPIGVVDSVINDGTQLVIAGSLFTGIEPAADKLAAKADAGMPWQMSVGLWPEAMEEIQAGALINGRPVTSATKVMRRARVRETSFVALGADSSTSAMVFNQQSGGCRVPFTASTTGEPNMSDPNADDLAAVTAQRDALQAQFDALQAQFSARQKAEREAAVKELLGEDFTAEKAAPYLDMTDVQFAAVKAQMLTFRARLPQGFTSEQATNSGSNVVTPEALKKFKADNPGATWDQAFAAVKGHGSFTAPAHF